MAATQANRPRSDDRLANTGPLGYRRGVSVHEIAEAVMSLSETERLELARRIVDTVIVERQNAGEVAKAVQGIEDILTGKVRGLTEAEFQRTLA